MYYLTVEDLQTLLPSLFTSKQLMGIGWSEYTPEDLGAILGRSECFIDGLRYKGSYKEPYQQHAFPRVLGTGYVVEKDDERVQKAVCCVVYDLLKSEVSGSSSREDLIRQGVKSISTGGVSESYGTLEEVKTISDEYVKFLGFCLFNGVL